MRYPRGEEPVFGLDIDGTMGLYHEHFLRFARAWLGVDKWPGPKDTRSQGIDWPDDMFDGTCSLAEYMGVSKSRYRQVKLAYRRGGLKRSMPAYKGAAELTRALRARGARVWVCTTRPFLQHDNVEPDTREWLRRNRIQYDAVLSGEHKYRDLVKAVGRERVVAVLDDLPEMIRQAQGLGLTAVLMAAPHNQWYQWSQEGRDTLWTQWWSPAGGNPVLATMNGLLNRWEASRSTTTKKQTSSRRTPTSAPVGT